MSLAVFWSASVGRGLAFSRRLASPTPASQLLSPHAPVSSLQSPVLLSLSRPADFAPVSKHPATDALLEDLQTSVARSPPGAMNGLATHEYREVRRTVRQETNTVPQELQVQYLTAANPTTVVAERSASPLIQNDGQRTVAYKTMAYQYNTSGSQSGIGNVLDTTTTTTSTDSTSDARLRQNLNELDNLLVDLHQAQKGSYSSPSAGSGRSTLNRVEVSSTRGIDSGLLEPVEMSTPLPPARQPHVSRSTQFQQQQQQYYSSTSGGRSASADNAPSPRLQPRRSTSAQRELVFDGPGPQGGAYYRDKSPSNQRLQREMFYSETKSSTSPRYRELSPEKSPSSQRVYYETKTTGGQPAAPWPNRYRDPSPSRYRDPSPETGSRVTSVRTYNYSTQGGGSPAPPHREPSPENVSRTTTVRSYNYSPAPPHRETSPDPGSSRVTTTRTYNYSGGPAPPLREPSPDPGSRTTTVRTYNYTGGSPAPPRREPSPDPGSRTTTVRTYNYTGGSPAPPRRDPFPEVPIPVSTPQVITYQTPSPQPGTKVTTTVRTYTYELPPGQQGYGEPPSAYHVSPPQPSRDKEPLVPAAAVPQQPDQPPTVITYKYSSHSSHNTSNKYPGGPRPEEQQPLLPRPFPTPSPTPAFPTDNQPPKRLDDLMASFSDTEPDSPPGKNYYITEKHTTTSTSTNSPAVPNLPQSNGIGMPAPSLKEEVVKKTEVKERGKTTNKAGPPVYYPPGVELFAKKEESMSMSASGKKASGRYEYEASKESKSKSSSSGGAAMVPVCLPVCCAMPCVIM